MIQYSGWDPLYYQHKVVTHSSKCIISYFPTIISDHVDCSVSNAEMPWYYTVTDIDVYCSSIFIVPWNHMHEYVGFGKHKQAHNINFHNTLTSSMHWNVVCKILYFAWTSLYKKLIKKIMHNILMHGLAFICAWQQISWMSSLES